MFGNWYRVTVDKNGVKSAERVDRAGEDGARIYYVQASNKAEAVAEARRTYLAYQCEIVKERQRKNRALKKCQCGRPVAEGKKRCAVCFAQNQRGAEIRRAIKAGIPEEQAKAEAPTPPYDQEMFNRYQILLEVEERLNKGGLRAWLWEQLRACAPPHDSSWEDRAKDVKFSAPKFAKRCREGDPEALQLLHETLKQNGENQTLTAKELGMPRRSLTRLLSALKKGKASC